MPEHLSGRVIIGPEPTIQGSAEYQAACGGQGGAGHRRPLTRAIRPIALNRKNALFAGSDGGGERWAVLASLVETCKLNGVEPEAHLADVLTRLVNGHPQRRLDDLLPWAYVA